MTCEVCKGTGVHQMCSPWEWRKQVAEKNTLDPDILGPCLIKEAPCPECRTDDFWGFLSALRDKYGPAFDDGEEITGAHIYDGKHGTVTMLTTNEGEALLKKKGMLE